MNDEIVDQVRRVREEHAAKFGFDIEAIFKDLEFQQKNSSRQFVHYPPRLLEPNKTEPAIVQGEPLGTWVAAQPRP